MSQGVGALRPAGSGYVIKGEGPGGEPEVVREPGLGAPSTAGGGQVDWEGDTLRGLSPSVALVTAVILLSAD